jgi:hypothetical protein
MAKSHTRKKYAKPPRRDIPQEVTQAADYIKQWTTRELGKIQHTESSPVCVPVKNGYKIGLYTLTVYPNKTCDVYDPNGEFIHRFETKISAILYTIYTIKKKYWIADDLLNLSTEINKNYTDMLSLRSSIDQATHRKDYVAVDIRQNRLEIAEFQLKLARDKILKIHKTAKYNKVWL